jgi:hypothetical protein
MTADQSIRQFSRQWTYKSGKPCVEATFVCLNAGNVTFNRSYVDDHRIIQEQAVKIRLDRLCDKDKDLIVAEQKKIDAEKKKAASEKRKQAANRRRS